MPTIVIANPDSDARLILQLALEHAGYRVLLSESPEELVALASTCALVITNYPTPVPRGGTVTQLLRADPATADVLILNATTHATPAEIDAARRDGVTETIVLPAELRAIIARVRALVGPP